MKFVNFYLCIVLLFPMKAFSKSSNMNEASSASINQTFSHSVDNNLVNLFSDYFETIKDLENTFQSLKDDEKEELLADLQNLIEFYKGLKDSSSVNPTVAFLLVGAVISGAFLSLVYLFIHTMQQNTNR